ncbi:hypothetical protein [Bacillus mojavensis]|uniref:hypothetical protein n=1 Tax=Bacillus mojavensis TaxID=72360 RepID=UPI002DB9C5F2|nr:hypothetical protein [Bacillus mojavensis]
MRVNDNAIARTVGNIYAFNNDILSAMYVYAVSPFVRFPLFEVAMSGKIVLITFATDLAAFYRYIFDLSDIEARIPKRSIRCDSEFSLRMQIKRHIGRYDNTRVFFRLGSGFIVNTVDQINTSRYVYFTNARL